MQIDILFLYSGRSGSGFRGVWESRVAASGSLVGQGQFLGFVGFGETGLLANQGQVLGFVGFGYWPNRFCGNLW